MDAQPTPSSASPHVAPKRPLPRGACDTHAHVFGPYERFPLAEQRPYTPPEAPKERYLAMLDAVGFDRGVLVHAGANGWDHRATLDAIAAAPDRLRGIGVMPADTAPAELARLAAGGIRGLRFTEVAGPNAAQRFPGRVGFEALAALAPAMRNLGWHAVVWANAAAIEANQDLLRRLGMPLVIDHLGYFDVARGVDDPAFRAVLALVGDGLAYIKLTAFRNSKQPPGLDDVEPFHRTLVSANPERLLWGSDWPYLGMKDYVPQPGELLDRFDAWIAGDDELRRRVLVGNPARLYGWD
ncbi:MAG: amidohydrolase family protein [Burkholderiales bacterium]|nr:amidohydrolase family protein [Burkholderiales bacterium]